MKRNLPLLIAVIAMSGCGYGTIQTMDDAAAASSHEIATQLQHRSDLLPNLVEMVKKHAADEDSLFNRVAQVRAELTTAIQSGNPERMALANSEVTGALAGLIAVAERSAELRADSLYVRLQGDLAGTENRIARARRDYMVAAKTYNSYIRRYPATFTAKVSGAKVRPYFEVTAEAMREAQKVKM